MNDLALTRLFLRFRDKRNGRALAAVFDAIARELVEVAAHLVRDVDEAEDVVQTTFRVAIERAPSFDKGRSLRGWLYGILAREAAKSRRRAARRVDASDLGERTTSDPLDDLIAGEVPVVLNQAIDRLPALYREVVRPVVCSGRSSREIARELGRAPGTVRVQVQRGLEKLRRLLPAEYGSSAAVIALSARGIGELRRAVWRDAGFGTAAPPAGIAVAAEAALALVAASPVAWLAAVAVLLGGLWMTRSLGDGASLASTVASEQRKAKESPLLAAAVASASGPALVSGGAGESPGARQTATAGAGARTASAAPRAGSDPTGGIVQVFVTDIHSQPVVGASIRTAETGPAVSTDATGRAAVTRKTETDQLELTIEADGFFHSCRTSELASQLHVTLYPLVTLHGHVLDDAGPVEGARVRLRGMGEHFHCEPVVAWTAADGSYSIPVPWGRLIDLDVRGPDHAPKYPTLELRDEGESFEVDFELDREYLLVTGRVVDAADGQPIVGAGVALGAPTSYTRTDENGAFKMRLRRTGFEVRVSRDDYTGLLREVEADTTSARSELGTIALEHAARILGRVVDREGLALAGARVRAVGQAAAGPMLVVPSLSESAPARNDAPPDEWKRLPPENDRDGEETDELGRFELFFAPHLESVELQASHPSGLKGQRSVGPLPGPGETLEVELALAERVTSVRGILSVNGKPVRGHVWWTGATRKGGTQVGDSGRFELEDVEPGALRLVPEPSLSTEATSSGPELEQFAVDVEVAGGEAIEVDLDVPIDFERITGHIRFETGEPAAGIQVAAYIPRPHVLRRGTTAADGSYVLDVPLLDLPYEVHLQYAERIYRRPDVEPGASDVDFEISPASELRLRVRVDGELSEGIVLLFWRVAGEEEEYNRELTAPGEDGWRIQDLPSGKLDLLIDTVGVPYFRAGVPFRVGSPTQLDLDVPAGATLALSCPPGSTLPPSHHVVLLPEAEWDDAVCNPIGWTFDSNQYYPHPMLGSLTVYFGPDGRKLLAGLAAGTYRFKACPDDIVFEPERIEVAESSSASVAVTWRFR